MASLGDKLDYAPSIPPSELFRRQVYATFEEDALAAPLIPLLGADSCMWASDYPHTDSTFPNSPPRSRRCWAPCPPPTAARSPRPTARGCTASPMQSAERGGEIRGFDHVSLPMQDTDAMLAFYRALGFDVAEHPSVVSVYVGDQMINFHRPARLAAREFTLRGAGRAASVR